MKGFQTVSNVLDLVDQTVFLGEQATRATSLIQCVWVYDRAIDVDGLRRFHHHLQRGRLSRRIERSPLPFGRHRWVSPSDAPDIEIVPTPRPRDEFDAWLSEQANTPLDSEHGPGWHLALLPFTDGGTGVSLVISHCLTDGVGQCLALADAACGRDDALTWPPAASRHRWRAVREDARQTARDMPAVGRAMRAAARMARHGRGEPGAAARAPKPIGAMDDRIVLPTATVFIDMNEWDARAKSLGGTSNALLAGLAADVAQRVGRVTAGEKSVALAIPVNERTDGDTRANAVTNVDVTVDPTDASSDLTQIRAAIKQALIRHREVPDERWALLPIAPLLPKRLVKRMVSVASGGTSSVVSSNLGDVDPAANRPDGTDADYFTMRSLYPGITRATMHRAGGVLAFLSGRINGRVFVSALGYLPGQPNSDDALQQTLSSTLAAFKLTAMRQWQRPVPVGH
jgi:hypothetical protein